MPGRLLARTPIVVSTAVAHRRTRSHVVVLLVVLAGAGCKSRGKEAPAGGPTVTSGELSVTFAEGFDATRVTLRMVPPPSTTMYLPQPIERYSFQVSEHFHVAKVIELMPEAAELTSAELTALLPVGISASGIRAVGVGTKGQPEDLAVAAVGTERVKVTVLRMGYVLLLVPNAEVTMLGTPAQILRGSSELLGKEDPCAGWLTPTSPRVSALARDPKKFAIADGGALTLDPPLAAREVDAPTRLLHADEILAAGGGDSVNTSVVLGSLLLARGYPVGLVSGIATFKRGQLTMKGFWQWAITIVDGKRYFVDAFDPASPRLVPLDAATEEHQLHQGRYCYRSPDGSPGARDAWAADSGVVIPASTK